MIQYLIRRLLLAVPVLLLVSVMVFSLLHLIPGDPVRVMLGEEATPEAVANLRHSLGFDRPLPLQFALWLGKVLRGDLGMTLRENRPVAAIIARRLPATAQLAAGAFVIALLIALPAGVIAAVRRATWADYGSTLLALSGVSLPNFWLGILLVWLVALKLGWLPASGYVEPWVDFKRSLLTTILPAFSLGFREAAIITRMLRSSLLEVLKSDYIRTAKSKGLAERVVIFRHALRNALIPVVTIGGIQFATLLGGAVITESIFAYPGMGRLVVESIFDREFPVVQAVVLVAATVVVAMNLAVDLTYSLIDPRIKYSGGSAR